MLKRILILVCGVIILSSVTVSLVDAQVKRCWTCGTDLCTSLIKIKGNLLKGDGVEVTCDAVSNLADMQTICLSPAGHLVSGSPPVHREVGGGMVVDDTTCTKEDRVKGKCPVEVALKTENTDYPSQAAFEAFWGVENSCNNNWTPIYVLQIISMVTIQWSKDGIPQGTIVAECVYPFEEIQAETTNNNTFIDFIPVEAECTILSE